MAPREREVGKDSERPPGAPTTGRGPLADAEPNEARPLEDPVLADRSNPRWGGEGPGRRPVQSLANPDGTPNVMPPAEPQVPMPPPEERAQGTAQDQGARTLDPEVGRDNIREGRGGGAANPALAEGGDSG